MLQDCRRQRVQRMGVCVIPGMWRVLVSATRCPSYPFDGPAITFTARQIAVMQIHEEDQI